MITLNPHKAGHYVTYKGLTHISLNDSNVCHIMNPLAGNVKLKVCFSKLEATNYKPATVVRYKYREYIVTANDMIISLVSGKVMQWDEDNGDRKAILAILSDPRARYKGQLPLYPKGYGSNKLGK